jgi:hypothetical protein
MSQETTTPASGGRTLVGTLRPLVTLTLLSIAIVALGCRVLPWRNLFPDFICYWTAAELVASGHSPYDPELQARIQQDLGWDEATHGLGLCPFLPYYTLDEGEPACTTSHGEGSGEMTHHPIE